MNRMKMKVVLVGVLTLGVAFLSGCLYVTALPTGIIEGFVVDHLSGEAVVGGRVFAFPLGQERPLYWVVTEYYKPEGTGQAKGYFRLVVPEGMYTLEFRKEGFATTRVEGVKVTAERTIPAKLHVVQKPVFNPNWLLEPPRVKVTGITEGMTIADPTAPLTVRIEARGPNDIQRIHAAFGKMAGSPFLTAPRVAYGGPDGPPTFDTGEFTIIPEHYGVSGDTTFEVVVYDWNDNRTHVIYRVFVTPAAAGPVSPPLEPIAAILSDPVHGVLIPPRTALAVTLSKKVAFFGGPLDPNSGEPLEPSAAPPGGNLYVDLRWRKSADDAAGVTGDGYRIYRRLEGEADFRLLYTVNADGRAAYLYRDSTPDLEVGRTAHYRIIYFRGTVKSTPLEASVTPLPPWDVKLVSPADEAKDVPLLPTFTWAPTKVVGTTQFYRLFLSDLPHGTWAWRRMSGWLHITPPLSATSVTYPAGAVVYIPNPAFPPPPPYIPAPVTGTPYERLQPHRVYQWQVDAALGIDLGANAVSVAVNEGYTGVFPSLAPWEMFTFTTKDW